MTGPQRRLYVGMLRLFSLMGSGGAAWTGVRGVPDGLGTPTLEALAARTIRFLEWNRVVDRASLPNIPIYSAPWWGLAAIDVDIQPGDIYTNGTRAFEVTGVADTSQGFQVIPAAVFPLASVPAIDTPIRIIAGFQAGLRIGAW